MAEKKANNKRKKILIAVISLLLVVGIVVLLVCVLPKGKSSQDNLNTISTISMADNEDIKADFQELQNKIETTAGVKYYKEEIECVVTLVEAIDVVVDFYNEYYPLAQNIGMYASAIDRTITEIKNSQRSLNDIQRKIGLQTTSGYTHLQNIWIDFRAEFASQANEYKVLFGNLNQMYHHCLGNALVVNDASRLVLNSIDDYMQIIHQDFFSLVQRDVKGSKEADYSLGQLTAKIDAFKDFVNKYLKSDRDFITKFYNSGSTSCVDLYKFFTLLGEKDYKNVINSICYKSLILTVDYKNDLLDVDNPQTTVSYAMVKDFLLGVL